GPDHPPAPLQYLRPDRGGPASRDLLHQTPQPAPAAPAHRPRPTRTPRPPPSPASNQPPRRGLHHQGPHDRLKTRLKFQAPSVQGSLVFSVANRSTNSRTTPVMGG